MNPDNHIQPNKKVVPKTSFHPETLNIERIEPPVIELTSRKPDGKKFNRKNIPEMDISLTARKPASARRKTGYKKTISKIILIVNGLNDNASGQFLVTNVHEIIE